MRTQTAGHRESVSSQVEKGLKVSSEHRGSFEHGVYLALLLCGVVVAKLFTQSTAVAVYTAFAIAFVGLQSKTLKRTYVIQSPFLLASIYAYPKVSLIVFAAYILSIPILAHQNLKRVMVLIFAEALTLGLSGYVLQSVAYELWPLVTLLYLPVRTAISIILAKLSGWPLDVGAISGRWALLSSMVMLVVFASIFHFNHADINKIYCAQITILGVVWWFGIKSYSVASEEFSNGIVGLCNMLSCAHPYTGGHSKRVAYLARETGRRLGIPEWRLDSVVQAALLHDIGKIAIDERILEKPGRLTTEEFALIKKHPEVGQSIVSKIRELKSHAVWIRHHHERIDGRGYPDGLKSKEIPIESRLISVIDAFDAMTGNSADGHRRLYRDPISSEKAMSELQQCSGTQFCPVVVRAFESVVREKGMML
jgi:putative nucleotidyltransferase with HDIG domain